MTLTAHAVVGAAVVAALPGHPLLGISAAFASHFLVDAIPHYDYRIRSASIHPKKGAPMKFDKALLLDFFSIGSDFALGILLGVLLFSTPATRWLIAAGAFAGMFPDALQFAYTRMPRLLGPLQRFHQWIHSPNGMRSTPVWGVVSQILFLMLFVLVMKMYVLP